MLGFSAISEAPISALPAVENIRVVSSLGPTVAFGTPGAAYHQTQTATGAASSTTFGTPTFGTTAHASTVGQNTRLGAPPKFGPTTLQIIGNGADAETTFFDVSPYYAAVTRNGSIAKSTAQSRFGSGSIHLTGASTANNLQVAGPAGRFNLSGKQFTIEAQVYLNAYNASGGRLLAAGGGSASWTVANGIHWILQSNASGIEFQWLWYGFQGGYWGWYTQSISAAVALSTWQHIEVSCGPSGTVRLFVEGAEIASLAGRPPVVYSGGANTPSVAVGRIPGESAGATNAANAYIQQIRIRNDAKHTAAFTAPTAGLPSWIGELDGMAPTVQVSAPRGIRVQPVSGFLATQFGTGFGQNLQRPTGFQTGAVGSPRIFPYSPVPFTSTQFGTGRLFPYHVAPGFRLQMGTPSGQQYWRASSLAHVAQFGTPTTPTDRIQVASGSAITRVGRPVAFRIAPPNTEQMVQAFGFRSTLFGAPSAAWLHLAQASGFVRQVLGTPLARTAQVATGDAPGTEAGTPSLLGTFHTTGFRLAQFGQPRSTLTQTAVSCHRPTRFGLSGTYRPDTYLVYGFSRAGRTGTPAGYSRFNYSATGFVALVAGTPSATESHRISHMPPCVRIGKPILRRSAQC